MLEAIKIRKAGYPVRRTYNDFKLIYKNLFKIYKIKNMDVKELFQYCFDKCLLTKTFD